MSSGLDYDRAKRRSAGRHGEPLSDAPYRSPAVLRGWRTEYPEVFPVTVTRIDQADPGQDGEAA